MVAFTKLCGLEDPLRLGQHIGNAHAFQYGAHSTTCFHPCTGRCRLDVYLRSTKLGQLFMRDGAFQHRHFNQVFLRGLGSLSYRGCNFTRLAKTPTYNAILITNDDYRRKAECTPPFVTFVTRFTATSRSFNSKSLVVLTLFIFVAIPD